MATQPLLVQPFPDVEVRVVPGWRNSGPAHWQSRWENLCPAWRRVAQGNWEQPRREDWIAALDAAIAGCRRPVVLVAHSLGCVTVAHWARRHRAGKVAAALLVAPADVERATVAASLRDFAPLPRDPLPFPSLLIASDNDPACTAPRAAGLARDWGSTFHLLAGAGHINADSGLGDWVAGQALFTEWLAQQGPSGAGARRPLSWVA